MTATNEAMGESRAEMVAWAAGLGAVSATALARLQRTTVASARARLAAAEREGLLVSQRELRGQPRLYAVTRTGLKRCDESGLEPVRLSVGGVRHSAVCCEVAAVLQRSFPGLWLLGEPAIRAEERHTGRPLASIELRGVAAGAALHRPDLVLVDRSGRDRPVAVEVELTVKAPRRLRAICRAWARGDRVAGVLYVVAAEVERPLRRAIEDTGGSARIAVIRVEELLGATGREPSTGGIASAA